MEVPDDQGLLVVNLDSCMSSADRIIKGDCVYQYEVTSNNDEDGTVIQIPVSVHCSEETPEQFSTVTQQYSQFSSQYTQVETGDLNTDGCERIQDTHETNSQQQTSSLSKNEEKELEDQESYYLEIYNYLTSNILPERASESYKKILKKIAQNYQVLDSSLYYGHKQPKRVITKKLQQQFIIKEVHIEKQTGIHLGVKKMYMAISQNFFWKRLYLDVANYVRQCKQCSEAAAIEQPQHSEQSEHSENSSERSTCKVWQKVELNILGPYPRTVNQNEYIIVIVDPFSRWIVARPISKNDEAELIASFLCKTFCTFGIAKCYCVGIREEVLGAVQYKYQECLSRIKTTLLTCGSLTNEISSIAGTLLLSCESSSHCTWVKDLWDEFVMVNPGNWDMELERFLFKYCTSTGNEASSPFTLMFGRSPISCIKEDKENCTVAEHEKPVEILTKRRRLQSSILQCRHCEEIFTSKISFRIHQRKHTEEARRQGILEGQEPPISPAERDKRLLRRTVLRRQRLLKQGSMDRRERLMAIASRKLHQNREQLPKDPRWAELQASTVDAVKKLLASTKEERRRRGKYHKYSSEIQEEIARYAVEHSNMETAKHYTQILGQPVSESTVRNIVRLYRNFTPGLKDEIGRFAVNFGVEVACAHFTERLGQEIRCGLVRKFKKLYLSHHPEVENKVIAPIISEKQKTLYSSDLKDEIGSHACQYGISAAVEHFAQKLSCPPKESTVRKFRKLYLEKNHNTRVSGSQQELHFANPVNIQEAVGSSTQTIDILHASLNILNNAQIGGQTAVVYSTPFQSATLSQIQSSSQLISSSNASSSVPITFHSVNNNENGPSTSVSYQQQTPVTASVIMNQNSITFNQSSLPLHNFQQQPQAVYSSYTSGQQSENSSALSQKATVTNVPEPRLVHHSLPQASSSSFTSTTIPTITFAIATTSQDQFHNMSPNPSVVMSNSTQSNNQQHSSQQSILVSAEHNPAAVVQQLVAPSTSHNELQQDQRQHRQEELQQSLPHIIGGTVINSSPRVLIQQPEILADPLIVEQQSLTNHTQTVEESSSFVQALNDSGASLSFDSNTPTIIADRDGTYTIATTVNSDISITVENGSNLESSHSSDEAITVQTQETQTSVDRDDVIISVVSTEQLQRTANEQSAQVPESESLAGPNTKIVSFIKVNSSMEEDVDDPLSLEILPKHKRKKRTRNYTNKKRSPKGNKRGNYTLYSPEIRAEMGKYAAEHGSLKACQHFKTILGHDIPESTVRGLRDKYLLKREACCSGGEKEITSLGYAPRGRPMRLGKYDEIVQECIRELIKTGEKVSSYLAIATAKQVLMQFEPKLLEENGGDIKLNVTWAKSFLKRIGVQNNS